jgi:hypothetical protein
LATHGAKDASCDPRQIDEWWAKYPWANIGVVTGAISGLVVVDVDGAPGERSLRDLLVEHGPFPATLTARTGSGGAHYFFKHPGRKVKNSARRLGPGLDIRGDGGYVVAPPSHHVCGGAYEWVSKEPVAALPTWLLERVVCEPRRPRAGRSPITEALDAEIVLRRECEAVAATQVGGRNDRLNKAAFRLGALLGVCELETPAVVEALREAAATAGLGDEETDRTIMSGLKAGTEQRQSAQSPPTRSATAQPHERPAPALAYEPRILDAFTDEVRKRGLVGEERNACILYLVVTSRLLDRQVSAGVKGHSSSGKSFSVETVLDFFPDDAVIVFTAMSEKALIYSSRDFRHRTLVVYEITALREGVEDDLTSYFVRTLLSEGRLDYEVTVRKDGDFTTRHIVKEGPTNLIFTTTKTRVHPENETRVLSLHSDDSSQQTKRVLLELATEAGAHDPTGWIDLQQWLAEGEHRVAVPFARSLAELIPPVAVRLRRDFGALLSLVRAHALLHRATRERDAQGRIVATVDDYATVRGLVANTIAAGVEATVSPTVRETVETVAGLVADEGIQARAVAQHLKIDKSNATRRLKVAADDGYLVNLEDRRGKPARWVLGDPLPADVPLLPTPADLAAHIDGCVVACDGGGMGGAGDSRTSEGGCADARSHGGMERNDHSVERPSQTCDAANEDPQPDRADGRLSSNGLPRMTREQFIEAVRKNFGQ